MYSDKMPIVSQSIEGAYIHPEFSVCFDLASCGDAIHTHYHQHIVVNSGSSFKITKEICRLGKWKKSRYSLMDRLQTVYEYNSKNPKHGGMSSHEEAIVSKVKSILFA